DAEEWRAERHVRVVSIERVEERQSLERVDRAEIVGGEEYAHMERRRFAHHATAVLHQPAAGVMSDEVLARRQALQIKNVAGLSQCQPFLGLPPEESAEDGV